MAKPQVCIGLLGPTLDAGLHQDRWNHWRPTVSLVQHEDMILDRMELLYQKKYQRLANQVFEDMRRISPETELVGHLIEIANPWDFEEVYAALHHFARLYAFDPDEEDYLLHITNGTHVAQICMFLLTESRHLPARLIQTSPPDRRTREAGKYAVIDLDLSRYDQIFARFQEEQRDALSFLKAGIETRNTSFNRLIERIERVAIVSRDPMLLTGPTGAGKTHLARRIYDLKRARRQVEGRFVEVNCATLRGDAAMSTLFGHIKGAYTGAVRERQGLLCAADHGVLFLDEIGELGLDEQAMLLRAIESKTFMPVGSDDEVASDFQLIAGTNRDLRARVVHGSFREDLLARINLWTFDLPGLRDRLEDVEPNLAFELDKLAERTGERVTMNKEASQRFLTFATSSKALWRGNFRDLNASVVRMATLSSGGRIGVDVVEEELERLSHAWRDSDTFTGDQSFLADMIGEDQMNALDRFDRVQLADVVAVCRRSKSLSEAGRLLFSESRKTKTSSNDADRLRKYLARFELDFAQIKSFVR